jgi:hypothetical protein
MKTGFFALAIALIALTVLVFTPGRSMPVAYAADSCGVMGFDVPDSGPNFDFSNACAGHDSCYGAHHGEGEVARKACDDAFLADMLSSCAAQWPRQLVRRAACNAVAGIYYSGVRLGGWLFFYG